MYSWLFATIAILLLVLIPFAPNLVRLRIRFLKWLHWDWAVNLLEQHFQGWVVFFRKVLFLLAILMLYYAYDNYRYFNKNDKPVLLSNCVT